LSGKLLCRRAFLWGNYFVGLPFLWGNYFVGLPFLSGNYFVGQRVFLSDIAFARQNSIGLPYKTHASFHRDRCRR